MAKILQSSYSLVRDGITYFLPAPDSADDSGITKNFHMVRQRRLTDIELCQKSAPTLLSRLQKLKNSQTIFITERLVDFRITRVYIFQNLATQSDIFPLNISPCHEIVNEKPKTALASQTRKTFPEEASRVSPLFDFCRLPKQAPVRVCLRKRPHTAPCPPRWR